MISQARCLQWLTVVAVLLVGVLPAATDEDAPAGTVLEVRVQGNEQMSTTAVLYYVRTRVGEQYDEVAIKADQQRLLETGRFDSVVVTRTRTDAGVIVTFTVTERLLVAEVLLVGNEAFKDAELLEEVPFGRLDPLDRFSVASARQAILSKYRSRGYYFVRVTVDEQALRQKRQVIYRIVEGPGVTISWVSFKGNRYFNTLRLRMAVGASARIWPFLMGYLDIEQIDSDVNTIRSMYVSEGFLDAEVSMLLELSDNKKRVKLIFVIEEGPRYRINRAIFHGNTVFSDDELARRLTLKPGDFFTSASFRRCKQAILDTYGELGYIEAAVEARRQFLDPAAPKPLWAATMEEGREDLLNIVFDIVEADQYKIGRIIIRGNKVTQGRVIRRELRFFPEQLFNAVAVRQSHQRLMDTGLFEKVTVRPLGKMPKVRDALVTVQERKTGSFNIGAGANSNAGLVGRIEVVQRNFDILAWPRSWGQFIHGEAFKGAGQTLRVVAEPGADLMRFQISLTEPYLFDKPYSLSTKVFMFTRGREEYDETRYGGVVSLGHRFRNRWYGELAGRIEGVRIDDLSSTAPPEVVSDEGAHMLPGAKGTLVRDRTDSRWTPTTGDRLRISYEQIFGDANFGRADGDYRIYRTVYVDAMGRKYVLSGRFSAGHIFGDAPVFERFYGGGIGSLRGFEYRGISPRSKGTDDQIGGDFMLFAGCQYEFPLFGREVRGAVFIDSGTVEEDFGINTYRISAGVGIRWIVPMLMPMSMSLDFGFPISKADGDDTQVLSFNLGWTF